MSTVGTRGFFGSRVGSPVPVPPAAEDLSSPIKSFTSDRAADDYVYRCDNDENDDCNHKNNS